MIVATIHQSLAMLILLQRRKRHDALLARIHERAQYARIVAGNWDAPEIDRNQHIKMETI